MVAIRVPAPDGGWGWAVVGGISIINLSLLPLIHCFGLLFEERFRALQVSAAKTSFLLHLCSALTCAMGLAGGPLLRRLTFRQVCVVGCIITALGVSLTSLADSYAQYIITYCVFVGLGQGLLYPAMTLAVNTYFDRRRSTATGLTVAMTGLGPVVSPPIVAYLITTYSVSGAVLLLGGIAWNSLAGALLLRPLSIRREGKNEDKSQDIVGPSIEGDVEATPEHPLLSFSEGDLSKEPSDQLSVRPSNSVSTTVEDVCGVNITPTCFQLPLVCEDTQQKLLCDRVLGLGGDINSKLMNVGCDSETKDVHCDYSKDSKHKSNVDVNIPASFSVRAALRTVSTSLDLQLLNDPTYLNILAGMGLSFVAELNFNMLIPFLLAELAGLAREQVAVAMSVLGAVDITARFIVPPAADMWRWSARTMYVVSLLGSIGGRTALVHFHGEFTAVLVICVLLGAAKGVKAVFQALVLPQYVTLEQLPAATGLLMALNGVLSLSLGPLLGYVRDASTSYVTALHVTSLLSAVCVLLWTVEAALGWRSRRRATS